MLKKRILVSFLVVVTAAYSTSFTSMADSTQKEPYPHLNSWGDKPAQCNLKPAEAAWLEEQIEAGNLRVATRDDVKAWEDLAKANGRPLPVLDCGRTFVILKTMHIPEINSIGISDYITFIIPDTVEFPTIKNPGSVFYDLKTGGAAQVGSCFVGIRRGAGHNPRECKFRNLSK